MSSSTDKQSAPPNIGHAGQTLKDNESSLWYANAWLSKNEGVESINDLTEAHVKGDNLCRILRAPLYEFANQKSTTKKVMAS